MWLVWIASSGVLIALAFEHIAALAHQLAVLRVSAIIEDVGAKATFPPLFNWIGEVRLAIKEAGQLALREPLSVEMEMMRKPEEANHDQIDRHDVIEQSRHEQN